MDLKTFLLKVFVLGFPGKVAGGLTAVPPCAPTGEVHMPSGKTAAPEIVDNKDGTVTVRYAPTEVGLHEMHIKYMGSHIPGESGSAPSRTAHRHPGFRDPHIREVCRDMQSAAAWGTVLGARFGNAVSASLGS